MLLMLLSPIEWTERDSYAIFGMDVNASAGTEAANNYWTTDSSVGECILGGRQQALRLPKPIRWDATTLCLKLFASGAADQQSIQRIYVHCVY